MTSDGEKDENYSRSSIEKISDFFSHLAFGESDVVADSKETSSSSGSKNIISNTKILEIISTISYKMQ